MQCIDTEEELLRLWNEGRASQFARLNSLSSAYRDLTVYRDSTGKAIYCSSDANSSADAFEARTWDRREGSPLLIWTYCVLPFEGRLYTDPPCHRIAAMAVRGFGEVPDPDWRARLRDVGLGEHLLEDLQDYLDQRKPISYAG